MNKRRVLSSASVSDPGGNEYESFDQSETVVPYDEALLEKARNQWLFGDWESLGRITKDVLRHHPDRAKLALLAAAGKFQLGLSEDAREFIAVARDFGCNEKLVNQVLAAGVYNSLARAQLLNGSNKALGYFEVSISLVMPQIDIRLATRARMGSESLVLGESANWSILTVSEGEKSLISNEVVSRWREQAIEVGRYRALFNYIARKDFLGDAAGKRNLPFQADALIGDVSSFYIKPGYRCRGEYNHYDDMEEEDKWQLEVYLHAYSLMKKHELKSVVDYGCGSGFKLIKYLGEFETTGYELLDNVNKLRDKYPDRNWCPSSFSENVFFSTDLVICSDVVEHLVDPNQLMFFLERQDFKYLVLSTPDRNLVRGFEDMGPPANLAHVREWSYIEFRRYVSDWFDIVDHRITNIGQGTQMIVCTKRH
ncbi:methyltransferase domain-containing protein [Azonexus sp.]|uniref:methyltransferase domain-containing protein n=1 Tax=Azonexus sp. TaxID=1872668 RepID=UPI0035AF1C9B